MPGPKQMIEVPTLKDLIDQIYEAFNEETVCVEHVEEILQSYKSDINEWKKYAKFDRFRYTRNLIDIGTDKFNIMLLCWGPSNQSTIHDHANAHCFMKVLAGSLEEVRFKWPQESGEDQQPENEDKSLEETSTTPLKTNGVVYMNDSLGLHRVQNASNGEEAVSLHIYSPPFDSCNVFDQRTGRKNKCKMTFWSRNGVKTNKAERC